MRQDEFPYLFDSLLINVTGFFRDPEAWDFMVADILPKVLARKHETDRVRVWCAGCASGEETYTVAILLAEALGTAAYWTG